MRYTVYLNFNGNASEAIDLYAKAFNQETVPCMRFKDNPSASVPKDEEDKILHAEIEVGQMSIMMSDVLKSNPVTVGNNMSINVVCDTEKEFDQIYNTLCEEGQKIVEPQENFFAKKYGILKDKFSITWQVTILKDHE